jgi:hypothetical protein
MVGDERGHERVPAPAVAPPARAAQGAHWLLSLQRTAGNRAVAGIVHQRLARQAMPRSLTVRDRVRRLARLTSWAGEWRANRYKDLPGQAGVDIELEFIPNDKVNAKLIGMVQTAMSQSGGAAPFRNPAVDPEWSGRSIDTGPNLGLGIDQLSGFINPLYITTKGAKGDTLTSTGTLAPDQPGGGRHGFRWVDDTGTEHKRSALMNDAPQLAVANDSKQEFETTAVAVRGEQFGTYYGSVSWGWRRDAAGTFTRLPLRLKRGDAPSEVFNQAGDLWNASSTAAGDRHVQLPTAVGRWIDHTDAPVTDDPGAASPTEVFRLSFQDRVEVTDMGWGRPFNRGARKWRKITVVSGANIGQVGWVLSTYLSRNKPTEASLTEPPA